MSFKKVIVGILLVLLGLTLVINSLMATIQVPWSSAVTGVAIAGFGGWLTGVGFAGEDDEYH